MFLIRTQNNYKPSADFLNKISLLPINTSEIGLQLVLGYKITKINRSFSMILLNSDNSLCERPASSGAGVLDWVYNLNKSQREYDWVGFLPSFLFEYERYSIYNRICLVRKINPFRTYFHLVSRRTNSITALSGGAQIVFGKYLIKIDGWYLKYPSGLLKLQNSLDWMLYGRASNRFHKWRRFRSFSDKQQFYPKWRRKVTGSAKNPVDHPNGGVNKPRLYKNPWGFTAKHGK